MRSNWVKRHDDIMSYITYYIIPCHIISYTKSMNFSKKIIELELNIVSKQMIQTASGPTAQRSISINHRLIILPIICFFVRDQFKL